MNILLDNKRRMDRIPVSINVQYDFLEEIKGKIVNLSNKGAMIEQRVSLPPGCCLDMKFSHPLSGKTVSAFGKVVWHEPNLCHNSLMGIEFLELSEEILN